MKVYFNASPRFKKENSVLLNQIYSKIEDLGYKQTSNFIKSVDVSEFYNLDENAVSDFYKKTLKSLKSADIVVLETSTPSFAVGYLVSQALNLSKPVIALHLKGNEPFFIQGSESEKLQIVEYTKDSMESDLKVALDYASDQQDTRFNFFISPKIANYLDWVAKSKRLPRAVYLRRLIEEHLENNEEYQNY